jgi:hypothetical protein
MKRKLYPNIYPGGMYEDVSAVTKVSPAIFSSLAIMIDFRSRDGRQIQLASA